jgi:tight adherence protein C
MFASPLVFAITLVAALLAGGAAAGVATFALVSAQERRALLKRATGVRLAGSGISRERESASLSLVDELAASMPEAVRESGRLQPLLVRAGFESETALERFALLRVALLVSAVAIASLIAPFELVSHRVLAALGPAALLYLAPVWWLSSRVAARQEAIRLGIPDALDLLVVSVEAGAGLDGALQRVARELAPVHPLLSAELRGITRRIAAGQPRQQALLTPWERTGVEELRGLAAHVAQSERWGTSIATVLRIYAEQMRASRRTKAERRAATATTRMLLPLALCIFPTIFVVLLGPAMMRIVTMFGAFE